MSAAAGVRRGRPDAALPRPADAARGPRPGHALRLRADPAAVGAAAGLVHRRRCPYRRHDPGGRPMTGWLRAAATIPVEIGRDEARRRALEELAKAKYGGTPEWLLTRLGTGSSDCLERLIELCPRAAAGSGSRPAAGSTGASCSPSSCCWWRSALVVWRVGLPRWQRRRGRRRSSSTSTRAGRRTTAARSPRTPTPATGRPPSATGSGPGPRAGGPHHPRRPAGPDRLGGRLLGLPSAARLPPTPCTTPAADVQRRGLRRPARRRRGLPTDGRLRRRRSPRPPIEVDLAAEPVEAAR